MWKVGADAVRVGDGALADAVGVEELGPAKAARPVFSSNSSGMIWREAQGFYRCRRGCGAA